MPVHRARMSYVLISLCTPDTRDCPTDPVATGIYGKERNDKKEAIKQGWIF